MTHDERDESAGTKSVMGEVASDHRTSRRAHGIPGRSKCPSPTEQARANERVAVVINPRTCIGASRDLWISAREKLFQSGKNPVQIETRGDGTNVSRVARLIRDHRPDLVVASGGDGTVSEVVRGMVASGLPDPPVLAILPFGTANNVARSLGLESIRHQSTQAIDRAAAVARNGHDRWIDLGLVDEHYFVGSFALGMDADILRMRDHWSRFFVADWIAQGYPLYLWSCGVNLLLHHGARARLDVDGLLLNRNVYNVLVTNTAIYGGEFRFAEGDPSADGYLDLHLFDGPIDYFRRYAAAWARHLRHGWGLTVVQPQNARRVRSCKIEMAGPVYLQIDGEQLPATDSCSISVVPHALRVRIPRYAW